MENNDIEKFTLKLQRKPESHKYDYGHVLVIAGSKNMPGAGVLCCNAAMRSGAGLVTYAVKEEYFNNACALSKPETMFFVYGDSSEILEFIENRKVSSVVIGPGLLPSRTLRKFIEKIISKIEIPVILDASGIAVFNKKYVKLQKAKAKLILTPHIGEFSKLLDKNVEEIEKNKNMAVDRFIEEFSLICVLKGRNTIVSNGKNIYVNDSGTPAMATAGSGDVLSGIIAAFAGIDDDLFEAAKFAVYVHGLSGEASEEKKGRAGVIASDLVDNIPVAMRRFK